VALAIKSIRDSVDVPLSIDTFRARVAEVINDVTGLKGRGQD